MNVLQNVANASIVITAVIGIITLVLKLIKEIHFAKPQPFRQFLDYENDFGDFLCNHGEGVMKIMQIKYFYRGQKVKVDSLVQLYSIVLNLHGLVWTTYLDNRDLIGRTVEAHEELRLVEIDPVSHGRISCTLKDDLEKIRENIKIEIIYKNIYGIKKTIKL